MKTLRSYQNIGEAGFAQSLLEAADIPAVLEHEGAALFAPMGVCAVRLQVPEEHLAEADQILKEHPVHFSGAEEDAEEHVPRYGFWRGSIMGLMIAFGAVVFWNLLSASPVSYGFSFLGWFLGGVIGACYRLTTPGSDGPKA